MMMMISKRQWGNFIHLHSDKTGQVGTIIPQKCWGPWPGCGLCPLPARGSAVSCRDSSRLLCGRLRRSEGPNIAGPLLWPWHLAKGFTYFFYIFLSGPKL